MIHEDLCKNLIFINFLEFLEVTFVYPVDGQI